MKIDLNAYGRELGYWVDAFEPFIDRSSRYALRRLREDLETGRDGRRPRFVWEVAKPIRTTTASSYDARGKSPREVSIGWAFHAAFELDAGSRKRPLWTVAEMVTHIKVHAVSDDGVILHFHHDMKNENQLGPHVHMQLSEDYLRNNTGIAIGVPRFPAAAMLPTDCLDFVLAEFFPFRWPQSQSGATGLSTLQASQQKRLLAMARALLDGWAGARTTPLTAIQDSDLSNLQLA